MRIRSTRPEFWRSERIAAVDWEDRLLLKGLESYVDDNGVGKDDLALIVGDLFQRDLVREPSRTLARVSEGISRLHKAGLVWRYEVDGTALLFVSFWDSVQRVDKPQPGRFRRPDGTKNYRESDIRECVASPREESRALAPVTGEQGNRGTEEQSSKDLAIAGAPADLFDDFWAAYPRKDGKLAARKAWPKAAKKLDQGRLVKAAAYWTTLWQGAGTSREHIPHASTWLNGERWNDEPPTPARGHLRAVSGGHTPYRNPTDQSAYDEDL